MPEYLSIADAGITALLGYAVVFLGIILLMIVVMIVGGIFIAADKRKKAAEPAPVAQPAEQLAEFHLEPQPQPSVEEPHKKSSRGAKVGTLIGGNLFSPEDIRLAVAKKNSKEAKSQVIEQTLF